MPPGKTEWIALVGGAVIPAPGARVVQDAVVLVRGDRIEAVGPASAVPIPPDARRIDCRGATVLAGFWNSHVHFFSQRWAEAGRQPAAALEETLRAATTRHGFTTVFDLGSMCANTRALRERVEAGEIVGPRILTTGEALVAPGAMPAPDQLRSWGFMVFDVPEIRGPRDAERATDGLLHAGVDGIKVHLRAREVPFSPAAVAAVVRRARAGGVPVFAHPETAADVQMAVAAGVAVVAHTAPVGGALAPAVLEAAGRGQVALIPTLGMWALPGVGGGRSLGRDAAEQVRAWRAVGGRVLFGNDHGALPVTPAVELAAMAAAGMEPDAILTSLTTAPAAHFGAPERGRVAPGALADLVVVRGDPRRDLGAFSAVLCTIVGGRIAFAAPRPASGLATMGACAGTSRLCSTSSRLPPTTKSPPRPCSSCAS